MRAAKVQASLRIRAVSPEPSLLAHISSESRGTFRQKARSLAPLNGWACAVIICHDGMLEDTNSLDGAHFLRCHFQQMISSTITYFSNLLRAAFLPQSLENIPKEDKQKYGEWPESKREISGAWLPHCVRYVR